MNTLHALKSEPELNSSTCKDHQLNFHDLSGPRNLRKKFHDFQVLQNAWESSVENSLLNCQQLYKVADISCFKYEDEQL